MRLPKRLIFVRHGQRKDWHSIANQQLPLTAIGKLQAEITGRYLTKMISPDASLLCLHSTLKRAEETASIALGQWDAGIRPVPIADSRLDEKSGGVFDELADGLIELCSLKQSMLKKRLGYYHYRAPGGENCPDVELKIRSLFNDPGLYETDTVLFFGHGRWFRIFQKLRHNLTVDEFLKLKDEIEVPNCCVVEYSGVVTDKELPEMIVPWKNLSPEDRL